MRIISIEQIFSSKIRYKEFFCKLSRPSETNAKGFTQ